VDDVVNGMDDMNRLNVHRRVLLRQTWSATTGTLNIIDIFYIVYIVYIVYMGKAQPATASKSTCQVCKEHQHKYKCPACHLP
jgi:hypothetical protein